MAKRIIFLLDGTWNDADFGAADTNIVRLRELIAKCLDPRPLRSDMITPGSASQQASISARTFTFEGKLIEHLVFYERGIGTGGFLDLYLGGALGAGLVRNVRRAYRFLSRHYNDGDEVFIFGFSRGSFTARSLVGYIGASGLLKRENCTDINESKAWSHYRANPADRAPPNSDQLKALSHDPALFRVACLAVFDTVGALGVPIRKFWRENRDLFEFHDVGLSVHSLLNLHAVAIDEHRESFEATLWRQQNFETTTAATEQVWFPGAHSDVGGGYVDERSRNSDGTPAMDDLPLDWMLKRIIANYPSFPITIAGMPAWRPPEARCVTAPQHEPRRGFYRCFPFAWRSIGNCEVPVGRGGEINISIDRHARVIGEAIHISALERLGRKVRIGNEFKYYAPKNIISLLDTLLSSSLPNENVQIVDWSGKSLHRSDSLSRIYDAKLRLQAAKADWLRNQIFEETLP